MESTQVATQQKGNAALQSLDPSVTSALVIGGDLRALSDQQKIAYYTYRCQQAGLDPAAKPFDLLTLNGKQILYANASCTQQLTQNRKLSHKITRAEVVNDIYMVCVQVTGSDNRSTENMGAVSIGTTKGEALANALMKATTKAIRRAVLAHCGLGMLDEMEAATIPGAESEQWQVVQEESKPDDGIAEGTRRVDEAIRGLSVCNSTAEIELLEESITGGGDWLGRVKRYREAKAERLAAIEAEGGDNLPE